MQQLLIDNLRIGFQANLAYGEKLAAGVEAKDMTLQPVPGVNHPAWILRHLSAYHPVLLGLLAGETPEDPKTHRFGMQSSPVADPAEYGPWDEVVSEYVTGGTAILASLDLLGSDDAHLSVLMRKMPVERWQQKFPMVGSVLGYLLIHHEGYHLGQLSAWRRFRGLASV